MDDIERKEDKDISQNKAEIQGGNTRPSLPRHSKTYHKVFPEITKENDQRVKKRGGSRHNL